MISGLSSAIRGKLASNATLTGVASGPFLVQAPQGQAYPYMTFFPVVESPVHTHTDIVEDTTWQISVFSLSLVSIGTIFEEIKNSLDNATLTLANLTQVGVWRGEGLSLITEDIEELGTVFHQPLEYRFAVQ